MFKRAKKKVSVIEIGKDWLKIVQAQLFIKEKKVSRVVVEKISGLSDDLISEKLKNLAKSEDINSLYLCLCVPHAQATVKSIELPSTHEDEIRNMLDLQIGKQTPFSREEVIFDHAVLNISEEGYSKVLLVIIHKDIVERFLNIIHGAGLKTDNIGLSSEGLLKWAEISCHSRISDDSFILMDVDYDSCDFEVIHEKHIIFSRNISFGMVDFTGNKDEWQKKITEQLNHCLYAFQNEFPEKETLKLVITGADRINEAIDIENMKKDLNMAIELVPQFKNIPENREFRDDELSAEVSYPELLGLVLTYPEHDINLIPQELLLEREVKEKGKNLFLCGAYIFLLILLGSVFFLGKIYSKERYLGQLQDKLENIRPKVEKLESMTEKTMIIEARQKAKDYSLNLIHEIHGLISPDIHLTSIIYDGKTHFTLRGTSKNTSEVFKFVTSLEESGFFINVKAKYATKRNEGDKELTDFEIVCPLEIPLENDMKEKK
ncbi:pilus assembly protein PilM [bacterium]|jgi:Tfp pilus assembly PilM family ATPase/Tfp pilus assembly protein PilN|nr:pilus assembly protein PilM [bacterium]